jgi:SAM-dependent methyltransferase
VTAERADTAASQDAGRLKQRAVAALRASGLLPAVDGVRSLWVSHRTREENRASGLSQAAMPPSDLMYDAYGHASWRNYVETGRSDSTVFAGLIRAHAPNAKSVLEWGCGPARILRHMPDALPGVACFGSDPNRRSLSWVRGAGLGLTVIDQDDWPPLKTLRSFDVIYGVSVLTHLNRAQQSAWLAELWRLLNQGGVVILTTHGRACTGVLLPNEVAQFDRDGFVERGGVQKGKRCFVTYHHPRFMRETLLKDWRVLAHIADNPASHSIQDIWVAQKDASA